MLVYKLDLGKEDDPEYRIVKRSAKRKLDEGE